MEQSGFLCGGSWYSVGRWYAKIGYNFLLLDAKKYNVSRENHLVWCKLPAIAEAMDTYPSAEWIWWLDLDAIIMTPHHDLYEYLLSSAAMKSHLLIGKRVIPNNRINEPYMPLPNLHTGEVHRFIIDLLMTRRRNLQK